MAQGHIVGKGYGSGDALTNRFLDLVSRQASCARAVVLSVRIRDLVC